jgi:hypothetical protein
METTMAVVPPGADPDRQSLDELRERILAIDGPSVHTMKAYRHDFIAIAAPPRWGAHPRDASGHTHPRTVHTQPGSTARGPTRAAGADPGCYSAVRLRGGRA